jgi:hypothetical protein
MEKLSFLGDGWRSARTGGSALGIQKISVYAARRASNVAPFNLPPEAARLGTSAVKKDVNQGLATLGVADAPYCEGWRHRTGTSGALALRSQPACVVVADDGHRLRGVVHAARYLDILGAASSNPGRNMFALAHSTRPLHMGPAKTSGVSCR